MANELSREAMSNAAQNTDREIWREIPGDFYSPSIHMTKENGLGINVGGLVYVMPVRAWHALRQQLAEVERQRDAHADLASEWRRELGALRQQLEQSQQLVTDGQEAIGHWQGEVYHVRQLLVDEKAIADHNLTDWHEAEHKIEQLRQRVRELEADRSIQMNGARTLARFVLNHLPEQHTTHGDGELFDCATAILESAVPHTTPWLIQMMEVARVDKSDLPQHLYQANQQLAAAQAKIITLTDALESGFMKGAYARLSELQHKEQKLYEAEARILELEAL